MLIIVWEKATKSTQANIQEGQENKPLPFKIYRGVESVPLIRDPKVLDSSTPTTLEAISMSVSKVSNEDSGENIPDLATLSQILFLAAGITKQKRYPGGEVYFRAYSNTGALYHIDLYLVTQDLPRSPGWRLPVRTS